MSYYLLANRDDKVIDSTRPGIEFTSPRVTQQDDPDANRQTSYAAPRPELPQADIGGLPASKIFNGFSNGFKSLFTRQQPFSGAVATPPGISNPVQGEVGKTNRASRLYAGVMNQLVGYESSQRSGAAYVGILPDTKKN